MQISVYMYLGVSYGLLKYWGQVQIHERRPNFLTFCYTNYPHLCNCLHLTIYARASLLDVVRSSAYAEFIERGTDDVVE